MCQRCDARTQATQRLHELVEAAIAERAGELRAEGIDPGGTPEAVGELRNAASAAMAQFAAALDLEEISGEGLLGRFDVRRGGPTGEHYLVTWSARPVEMMN